MDIETDQGIDLWNLLCYYEDNYKGIYKKNTFFFFSIKRLIGFFSIRFSDERIRLQKEEMMEATNDKLLNSLD